MQIQPWTRALDDADYTPPTRQHEVLFDRTHEKRSLPRLADLYHLKWKSMIYLICALCERFISAIEHRIMLYVAGVPGSLMGW